MACARRAQYAAEVEHLALRDAADTLERDDYQGPSSTELEGAGRGPRSRWTWVRLHGPEFRQLGPRAVAAGVHARCKRVDFRAHQARGIPQTGFIIAIS